MKRLLFVLATACCLAAAFAASDAPLRAIAAGAATPPSPPPLPTATSKPIPPPGTPTAPPSNITKIPVGATPTPAPPKDTSDPNRIGISGVWEVQIQRPDATTYAHFKLTQTGSVISGVYMDPDNKQFPLAGSIDVPNHSVRIVVSTPGGGSIVFAANEDNATDMLGGMTTGKDNVAFTAAYRPKYKFLDNINPSAGGLGTGGP